ncbi:hypothetical protein M378DRAFT_739081 [Amanita muscaria Koide BX008]|uniref:Uncharacterized protein n=1 Tax=Amanita muscaria (strain Koide BX008) TaxID=946122 RepID=A0A0C2WMR4_AMAMK|nr:hypothetical protein M378DRAFT_739081 [Amanita muscaria Koide BX008]
MPGRCFVPLRFSSCGLSTTSPLLSNANCPVFVQAEPDTIGGGAKSSLPSSVWASPTPFRKLWVMKFKVEAVEEYDFFLSFFSPFYVILHSEVVYSFVPFGPQRRRRCAFL